MCTIVRHVFCLVTTLHAGNLGWGIDPKKRTEFRFGESSHSKAQVDPFEQRNARTHNLAWTASISIDLKKDEQVCAYVDSLRP